MWQQWQKLAGGDGSSIFGVESRRRPLCREPGPRTVARARAHLLRHAQHALQHAAQQHAGWEVHLSADQQHVLAGQVRHAVLVHTLPVPVVAADDL